MFAPLLARAKFLHSEPPAAETEPIDTANIGGTSSVATQRLSTPLRVGISFLRPNAHEDDPGGAMVSKLCVSLRAALSKPGHPRCAFAETGVSSVLQLPAAAIAQARAGADVVVVTFPKSTNETWELSALLTAASAGVVTPIVQGQYDAIAFLEDGAAAAQYLRGAWENVRLGKAA